MYTGHLFITYIIRFSLGGSDDSDINCDPGFVQVLEVLEST